MGKNKILLIAAGTFMLGYIVGDVINGLGHTYTQPASAEVAGMGKYDLIYDYDFKSAVESIVEDCTADGDVDGNYVSAYITC